MSSTLHLSCLTYGFVVIWIPVQTTLIYLVNYYKMWNKIIYNLLSCTQKSNMKITTKYSRVYGVEMIFMIELNSKPKSVVGIRQVNKSTARALPKQDQQLLTGVWTMTLA